MYTGVGHLWPVVGFVVQRLLHSGVPSSSHVWYFLWVVLCVQIPLALLGNIFMLKIFMARGLCLGLPSSIEVGAFRWEGLQSHIAYIVMPHCGICCKVGIHMWSMHANQIWPRACRSKSPQLQYNTVSQTESSTCTRYRKGQNCYSLPCIWTIWVHQK